MGEPGDLGSAKDILRLVSNPVNLEILVLLSTKPSYPRELARILGRDETDISRRLRLMECAGLVEGSWRSVEKRNIKVYRLAFRSLKLEFDRGELRIRGLRGDTHAPWSPRSLEYFAPEPQLFAGREEELGLIAGSREPIVVIWGMSGIGKTSLAAKALVGSEKLYWHTLTRLDTPEYVLWRLALFLNGLGYSVLLDYMGRSQGDPGQAVRLAVRGLKGSGATLVFDDYHVVENTVVGQLVRTLALEASGYRVILISRRRPRGLPYHEAGKVLELALGGLSPQDSKALVEAKGLSLSPDEMAHLYSITLGHPLLLQLFAEVHRAGKKELYQSKATKYLWDELYATLTEPEKRIVSTLSAFNEPLPPDVIAALTGVGDPEIHLYRLYTKALVEQLPEGYRVHPLVSKLMGRRRRRSIYFKTAEIYASRGGWVDKLKAIRYYMEAGAPEKAAEIIVERFRRGDYGYLKYLHSYQGLVESLELERLPPRLRAYVLHDKAMLKRLTGREAEALEAIEDAIVLAETLGDKELLTDLYTDKASILTGMGRLEEALASANRGYELALGSNKPLLRLIAHAAMANILAALGRWEEAYNYAMEEFKIVEALGDPYYMAWGRIRVARFQSARGLRDEAEFSLMEAYRISREFGLEEPKGAAALALAEMRYTQGDSEGALVYVRESIEIFEKLGVYMRLVKTKYLEAEILESMGRHNEALKITLEALKLASSNRDHKTVPLLHWLAGKILLSMGRTQEALEHFTRICSIESQNTVKALEKAVETLKEHGLEDEARSLAELC